MIKIRSYSDLSDMDQDAALSHLRQALPISLTSFDLLSSRCGLVLVDVVNGFCTVGSGPLAPTGPDERISGMLEEACALSHQFVGRSWPVLAILDCHEPGIPEPPYPRHCERGSGQDLLVPSLAWLESSPGVTLLRKDCINAFVGAMVDGGRNRIIEWIFNNKLQTIVVAGVCTDICVLDFVSTIISARNHSMIHGLVDVVVYEPACATYDLPIEAARAAGLAATAAHPQAMAHHLGIYQMASRGAVLVDRFEDL